MTKTELSKKNHENKKFCRKCEKWVVKSGFSFEVAEIGRRKNICKECIRDYQRERAKQPAVIAKEKARNAARVKAGYFKDYRKKERGKS